MDTSLVVLTVLTEIVKVVTDASVRSLLPLRLHNHCRAIPWFTGYRRILDLIPSILGPVLVTSRANLRLCSLDYKWVLSDSLARTELDIGLFSNMFY